jgi:hypothetical protein
LYSSPSIIRITSWWLSGVARVLNYPNPLSHQQHTSPNFFIYKNYTTTIIWFPQQCESSRSRTVFILTIRRLFHCCNSCSICCSFSRPKKRLIRTYH